MVNVLAIYGSAYGQTEKIVKRIAARDYGYDRETGELHPQATPRHVRRLPGRRLNFRGRHQRYIEEFVRTNAARLRLTPSAFVSVSGAAASPIREEQARAQLYVEQFFQATGWRASASAVFGGAMAYTKYRFPMRWIIRFISARRGGPTDMTRDHELTDWTAVDHFADRPVQLFQPARR